MATELFNKLYNAKKHGVGNVVSTQKYVRDFANGGFYIEDVENFTLVQGALTPTDATAMVNGASMVIGGAGELHVKQFVDETTPERIFLAAGVERRYSELEGIEDFYNGMGEKQRVVFLTVGLLFDTSSYEPKVAGTPIAVGDKVFFDTAKKKFVVDNGAEATDHPVFFQVRRTEEDTTYTLGQPLIRLEVIKGV